MTEPADKIRELETRLEALVKQQEAFSREVSALRRELDLLKGVNEPVVASKQTAGSFDAPKPKAIKQPKPQVDIFAPKPKKTNQFKGDLEKFIGENLINKIGIAITIIGVAIGAKYAIDKAWITPVMRIILGYVFGVGLLGIAIRLREKYDKFSAVLLSGAMAILYFITFFGYTFYDLFPVWLTFLFMLLITGTTVFSAWSYNNQVIAGIGMVGAYAVPILLSDGTGEISGFFTYMTIINTGILIISFKKYWKALSNAAFLLTWLVYLFWYLFSYDEESHFTMALVFPMIFFAIFYATNLAYKVIRKESFAYGDVLFLLGNTFVFYALGYDTIDYHDAGEKYLGVFTLVNAVLHAGVSLIISANKDVDRKLLHLISGIALTFVTAAIVVQWNGNWVTILWAGEAAILFSVARTRGGQTYEKMATVLICLAFGSLVHDWLSFYEAYDLLTPESRITPVWNVYFLTAVIFVVAISVMNYMGRALNAPTVSSLNTTIQKITHYLLPGILIISIHMTFRMEIVVYWDQLYADALSASNEKAAGILKLKDLWLMNYSILFMVLLAWSNLRYIRQMELGLVSLILMALSVSVFLIAGLDILSGFRDRYLLDDQLSHYPGLRYLSFGLVGSTLFTFWKYREQPFMKTDLKVFFFLFMHLTILFLLGSELVHWFELSGSSQSDKLGLSILWGVYALYLIVLGIWKKLKYLRIFAIVLFGVTLIKLFFYDLSSLDTIGKTIVLVALGLLLLVISFLYNKYKHLIFEEEG